MTNALLAAALDYAGRGWPVFPLAPGTKKPPKGFTGGFHNATCDATTIRQWWDAIPRANVGIATGASSGLVILDVDGEHGAESLTALEAEHGRLPDTVEAISGSGGRHLYFQYPGEHIPCSQSKLAPGLDIKADGGYVVSPPSRHPDGGEYVWEVSGHPDETTLAPLPSWLVERLRTTRRERVDVAATLAEPRKGQRDADLFRLACLLRGWGVPYDLAQSVVRFSHANCEQPAGDRFTEEAALAKLDRAYATYQPEARLIETLNQLEVDEFGVEFSAHRGEEFGLNEYETEDIHSNQTTHTGSGQNETSLFRTPATCSASEQPVIEWIAEPYFAAGALIEFDAKIKVGKTTFLLHLCGAVLDGNGFVGFPTKPTKVVYLTEQSDQTFRTQVEQAGMAERDDFYWLPWYVAAGLSWPKVVDLAVEQCQRVGARLLIVDTLSKWAGLKKDEENQTGPAQEALAPLQIAAAKHNLAVVVVRHERKSGGDVGDSARGASAFGGGVDHIVALRRPEGNARKTIRVLHDVGRLPDTPGELTVELTPNGFISHGPPHAVAEREAREAVLARVPSSEGDALTFDDLLNATGCSRSTLQRAVDHHVEAGSLKRKGEGKKGDPYRFWRPSHELRGDHLVMAAD
jgi:hypothetical protein